MGLHDAEPAGHRRYAIGVLVALVVIALIITAASELRLLIL